MRRSLLPVGLFALVFFTACVTNHHVQNIDEVDQIKYTLRLPPGYTLADEARTFQQQPALVQLYTCPGDPYRLVIVRTTRSHMKAVIQKQAKNLFEQDPELAESHSFLMRTTHIPKESGKPIVVYRHVDLSPYSGWNRSGDDLYDGAVLAIITERRYTPEVDLKQNPDALKTFRFSDGATLEKHFIQGIGDRFHEVVHIHSR